MKKPFGYRCRSISVITRHQHRADFIMVTVLFTAIAVAADVAISFAAGAVVELYRSHKEKVQISKKPYVVSHSHTSYAA